MRRKMIDLMQQRAQLVEKAEALLKDGRREEYRAEMDKVAAMNTEIQDLQKLLEEQRRHRQGEKAQPGFLPAAQPPPGQPAHGQSEHHREGHHGAPTSS